MEIRIRILTSNIPMDGKNAPPYSTQGGGMFYQRMCWAIN